MRYMITQTSKLTGYTCVVESDLSLVESRHRLLDWKVFKPTGFWFRVERQG